MIPNPKLSILIAAKNAAGTIERAVRSALAEDACQILLIDDHCEDATVGIARSIGGDRLRVIQVGDPGGIPVARQMGLEAVESEYAAWLDADDEWIAGRATRMIHALDQGADVVMESIDLHDGATGLFRKRMEIPPFLMGGSSNVRLFERNYLPGDSQVGFRVSLYRGLGGYDPELYGVESFDMLLRAVASGARFRYFDDAGYRMYAYPGSVSRNLVRQRAMVARALKKHPYEAVRGLYEKGGFSQRVTGWGLCLMAMFREEWAEAARFLEEACPVDMDPDEVLEPDGPYPVAEGWRYGFTRGTLHLLMDAPFEAVGQLESVIRWRLSADVLNNLGVAYRETGAERMAMACFEQAWEVFPGYLDASVNMEQANAARITIHPLRMQASRSDYRPESPS